MAFKKENRFRMTVQHTDGTVKTYYPKSIEQKNENLHICRERGYRVIECVKLYPFNTYANQHNFELIHNIVMCELYDIWNGEKKVSDEEYERLEKLKEQSEKEGFTKDGFPYRSCVFIKVMRGNDP